MIRRSLHPSSFVLSTFALVLVGATAFGAARLDGDWIVVEGSSNTLASVARDLASPKILSYDGETGYATAARSFRIAGGLTIGGPETTGSLFRHVDSLEFDVGQCGQARIQLVAAGGEPPRLSIENSRIATLRTDEGNDACQAEGNLIQVGGGRLSLRSSTITGNFVLEVDGGAVELLDSSIMTSNHAGLNIASIDGGDSRIAGLHVLDHQIYGIELGPLERALTLADCTIRGGGADLHVRGRTELVARDCDFDSIRFAGQGGRVKRQWTVQVRTPAPGCRVVAESESGVALPEKVEVASDKTGVARVGLTEFVARPGGFDYLRKGKNDSTPHRLTVYAAGGDTVLGQIRNYRVFTRGQEIRIP
jgi:hypothetical protein